MFKKKIAQQDYEDREQTEYKASQVGNGIEAKLNSIISNNNRMLQSRQQHSKSNSQTQPSGFFSKYSHKKPTQNVETWHKKQSLQSSLKNIPLQITKAPIQKKSASFENQLKGLIKIIYQKQKEIQKLKLSIKEVSDNKNGDTQCKHCMRNGLSSQMEDMSLQSISLNIKDIKQTTGKIIQLEEKQSQLHEIIDFLMKKQEDSNKKIKELSQRNKQLQIENDKLLVKNQQLTLNIENLSQQQHPKQQDKSKEFINEIEILKGQLKEKDDEILKLNSDILKIVHSGKKTQNQMSQKIALLNKENRALQNKNEELQKNQKLINDLKTKHLHLQNQIHSHRKEKVTLTQKVTEISNQKCQLQQQSRQLTAKTQTEKLQLRGIVQEQSQTINKLQQTINKLQQTINQLQSRIINLAFQTEALQCENTLLNSRLSQTESQSTQKTDNYNQLLQQIRLNSTNKSTIEEYKKLFQKIKLQNHTLQINHQKEIKDYEENAQKLQAKIIQLQIALQTETKKFSQQNTHLRLQLKKKEDDKIQLQTQSKVELETRQNKYTFEMNGIKEYYENEIKVLNQELHLAKQSFSKQRHQLQKINTLFQSNLNELESLKDQLNYEEKLSLENEERLLKTHKKLQQVNQHLIDAKIKLNENDLIIGQLNSKIVELQRKVQQNQINHHEQSLQIDIQCQQCKKLEAKNYQLKLESEDKDQIISLPTMGNLSSIQFANSSFQCKLQDLVQFSSRHLLAHQNQTPKTQKQLESKRKTTILLPLQQKSLQQDSSYIRYQDQLIKQLEKQCNEPTEEFIGHQNQKERMELSEVKQSLKMTKQVNFQLFQQINRQQKLINEFKSTIKQFIQLQKQLQGSKVKNASKIKQQILNKLSDLLVMK